MRIAQITNPILPGAFGSPGESGGQNIANVIPPAITLAFIVGSIIFFAMLVWGAIEWISSGGDKQKLESARGRITSALVGIILLFAAFAIINIIEHFFNVHILTNLNLNQLRISQ